MVNYVHIDSDEGEIKNWSNQTSRDTLHKTQNDWNAVKNVLKSNIIYITINLIKVIILNKNTKTIRLPEENNRKKKKKPCEKWINPVVINRNLCKLEIIF